jgi:predicted extracellular nuclease
MYLNICNRIRDSRVVVMLLFYICTFVNAKAQKAVKKQCAVAFYNVENLFDTDNEPKKEDDDFTPNGAYHYTNELYQKKLYNIASVLHGLALSVNGPSIIGLAEVENNKVLNALCSQAAISKKKYKYVWYDGPDVRGIDVALLYDPASFVVKASMPIPVYVNVNGFREHTRDILFAYGILNGEDVYIMVNHWPSRREGQAATAEKRHAVAVQNKHIIDSLSKAQPDVKVILMGDLNDNPVDESVQVILNATGDKTNSLYNPWVDVYLSGRGTSRYKQSWELFDQIIISKQFLSAASTGWKYDKVEIYNPPILQDKFSKGKGFPYRSFKGTYWVNGYSDHFPVIMYFKK